MKNKNVYENLEPKTKNLIDMYITARQFKNAVLEEEMIILPAKQNGMIDGTILKWGGAKITFKGDKQITRIYPFIVNKAFACEVYLKLVLIVDDFDFMKIKRSELHELLKLYENTTEKFKEDFFRFFLINYGKKANKEFLENEIKNISNVFKKWRYIYEQNGKENIVNNGFLNIFCDYLDKYSQKLILDKYNYDVSKDMR